MNDNLKRCPFCGGAANVISTYNEKKQMYYTRVKCGVCFAESGSVRSESVDNYANVSAAARWNQRQKNPEI